MLKLARDGWKEEVALSNNVFKDSSARTYHRKLAKEEGRRAKRVWSVLFHPYDELFWASLIAQLVKNLLVMQETLVQFLGQEIHWRRVRLPTPIFLGSPCGSAGKEFPCNARDVGLIPRLGRSPGEGKGNCFNQLALNNSDSRILAFHLVSCLMKKWNLMSCWGKKWAKLGEPFRTWGPEGMKEYLDGVS